MFNSSLLKYLTILPFTFLTQNVSSQISITNSEIVQEIIYKPTKLDSTISFYGQGSSSIDKLKNIDLKSYVGHDFYLPHIKEENMKFDNDYSKIFYPIDLDYYDIENKIIIDDNLTDNYYTLIEYYYGDSADKYRWNLMKSFKIEGKNDTKNLYHEKNVLLNKLFPDDGFTQFYNQNDEMKIFVLKNKHNGDTIVTSFQMLQDNFVFMPYFNWLKSKYENKYFIAIDDYGKKNEYQFSNGGTGVFKGHENTNKQVRVMNYSKWLSTVNLIDSNSNIISIKFKNISNTDNLFFTSSDMPDFKYNIFGGGKMYSEEKYNSMVNKNILEQKKQKENNAIIEKKEKDRKIEFKRKCIEKYGFEYGSLVAEGKLKIGMSREMCLEAWGKPINSQKTITSNRVSEILIYNVFNLSKTLFFENGILVKIVE